MSFGQSELKTRFDAQDLLQGLDLLDTAIGTSKKLQPYLPIKMIASGGVVSLLVLRTRSTTADLDYFIGPEAFGEQQRQVSDALKESIRNVSSLLGYVPNWCNSEISEFLSLLNHPSVLFERSISQGTIIFQGINLTVFAVLWEWVLVRKMKRLQLEGQRPRAEDWNDCIAILYYLTTNLRQSIKRKDLRQFDDTEREPPVFEGTIDTLNNLYKTQIGSEFDAIT